MKKLTKGLLFFVVLLIIVPIFSIIFVSFSNTKGDTLHWYSEILINNTFLDAVLVSIQTSIVVALITTIFAFLISLAWFNTTQRFIVILLIIILGLIPPDILSLGISKISQLLHLYNSNLLFTVVGLSLYCLPFSILLLWSRYYFIDDSIIKSARDIGMNKRSINLKIILPLAYSSIASSILFSFILALNEYPRTYYLSGYHTFLSEYLFGKLSSGANESIYAGSSIIIFLTLILFFIGYLFIKSMNFNSTAKN